MVNFMPWQLHSGEKLRLPLNRKLGGPQSCFGCFGEENKL